MSTLVQIESAVAGLPHDEQWSLLNWLQARLAERPGGLVAQHTDTPAETEEWMAELEKLRESIDTGRAGISIGQLMDEIREERF